MNWADMATIGRIARPHGLRGQVVVNPETDFPQDRFQPGATVFVERKGSVDAVTLTTVRFQQDRPVIGIAGVDSIDEAEAFAGLELRVPLEWLTPLPEGVYYRHDLIGCRVETTSGDPVGTVSDVDGTFAGSRLVVAGERGEVLIPLATEMCRVELEAKRIVVDLPEGLLELNDRKRSTTEGTEGKSSLL